MLTIQRLNMDSSWFISWKGIRFIVDPWLMGSEIDGGRWINEQWHNTEPVSIENIPEADFILITQSYSDHCHIETLSSLNDHLPILATTKAYKLLNRKFPNRLVHRIQEVEFTEIGDSGISFVGFRPNKMIDPIYFSVVMAFGNEAIFISPHGFKLGQNQREIIKELDFKLLITTFSDFRLPQLLGGHVNPGMENVDYLIDLLDPDFVVNSHDEEKQMSGLVGRYAKVTYPDVDNIELSKATFFPIKDYQAYQLNAKL